MQDQVKDRLDSAADSSRKKSPPTIALLQFSTFDSFVEPSFWWKLTETKVNVYKLDDSPRSILAYYSNANNLGLPCRLTLDFTALDPGGMPPTNCFVNHGTLYLSNTVEDFRNYSKKELLRQMGASDAKKYHYYYWFGYPALCFPDDIRLSHSPGRIQKLSEIYNNDEMENLKRICTEFSREDATGYFVLEETEKALFKLRPLSLIKDTQCDASKIILGFCDPSTNECALGWPARNLLALWAHYQPNATDIRLLCWRQRYHKGKVECDHSLLVKVTFTIGARRSSPDNISDDALKVVGWEKNEKGQLGPRFVDLSNSMQPEKLADNAINLNLQLMRWRLVPDLNLDLLTKSSCLIFGAGTLGCNVARCCLAWGIRKITFIDSAKVSYSNPVRQSLFTFDDCVGGGRWKAEAAAAGLKRVFPNTDACGYHISIPMPGHVVGANEVAEIKKSIAQIEDLVKLHDLIFLLLDTREGRWLPTVLATLHSKLTFSVALGFDSYVVVRHGYGSSKDLVDTNASLQSKTGQVISGDCLGCYFCTDVVAPSNSTIDRTLDQQCTVTRPGLSMIASALAVELAVSVLQHPLKGLAPAIIFPNASASKEHEDEVGMSKSANSCLGYVAHQIRGYASTYEQLTAAVQRFSSCTACSNAVTNEYKKRGFDFLQAVFNDPLELERVTGLDAMKRNTEASEIMFLSDCDSE